MSDLANYRLTPKLLRKAQRELNDAEQAALLDMAKLGLVAEVTATEERLLHLLSQPVLRHSGAEVDLAAEIAAGNPLKARLAQDYLLAIHEMRMQLVTKGLRGP